MQFATTYQSSMCWLSGRYRLSAGFGLVGAPLAFFAGEKLGAVEFLTPRGPHYVVLALLWAHAIPLLIYISDHLPASGSGTLQYRWPGTRRQPPAGPTKVSG
jgi:hypothetical protein